MPSDITLDELTGPAQQPAKPAQRRPITFDEVVGDALFPEPKDPAVAAAEAQGQVPYSHPVTRDPIRTPVDSRATPALKSQLVEDPDTRRRLVAESMYPNDPRGMDRIGIVGGRMVTVNDAGQLEYVADRWGEFGTGLIANAPEIAGATIGSLSGQPILGSTLGVMGGDAWKRVFANRVFGEPQTALGNAAGIAKEGALNLAVAGATRLGTAAGDRGRVVSFAPADQKAALATQAEVKQKFGIDLNIAQASGDPRIVQMWRYLSNYPGKSAEIAGVANDLQAGQVDSAVQKFIALTGQGYPSQILGKQAIDISRQTIKSARDQLSDEVAPLYEAAYRAVPVVDRTTPHGEQILDFLKLPYFREAFSAGQKLRALKTGSAANPRQRTVETLLQNDAEAGTWNKATTVVDSTSTGAKRITSRLEEGLKKNTPDGLYTKTESTVHSDITRPSLEELDYTKRALDERIDALYQAGQRQRAAALKQQRDRFVGALDALPNQEWQAARQAWQAGMTSTVEPLEKGLVGFLSKVSDPKAATIATKVFTDPNIGPREILQAKGAILSQEGGKEAWDGLTRQWLARAWTNANKVTQLGEPRNASGKFAQTLGATDLHRARLVAALGQERGQLAMDLISALRRVASTSGTNSDTAFMQEISRTFRGPFSQGLKSVASPRTAAIEEAERRAIERTTERIAQAMTDPKKVAQLRVVVKMPPGTKQAMLLGSLLGLQGVTSAVGAGTSGDQIPPGYTPR